VNTTTTTRGRHVGSRIGRRLAIGLTLFGTAAAGACERASTMPSSGDRVVYGPEVALGAGTARTYLQMVDGVPVELGIALSENALSDLPGHHSPGGVRMPDGHHMFEYVLAMPEGNPTPFRHVLIDWNPGGHEPPGVYDLPHFDFHFYTMTVAERRAIDPADPAFAVKAQRFPAAGQMPAGYTAIPGAVPFMGAHWVDPTSPELHGETFTQTFIYGSWDGRLIFAEPMITRDFLASKPDFERTLPVPEQYAQPGYYPASYSIRWDEASREHWVALGGFTLR
jgi:hypothetical protein